MIPLAGVDPKTEVEEIEEKLIPCRSVGFCVAGGVLDRLENNVEGVDETTGMGVCAGAAVEVVAGATGGTGTEVLGGTVEVAGEKDKMEGPPLTTTGVEDELEEGSTREGVLGVGRPSVFGGATTVGFAVEAALETEGDAPRTVGAPEGLKNGDVEGAEWDRIIGFVGGMAVDGVKGPIREPP